MKIYNYKLTRYKFNSKELDQETGLYYYGARYYSPYLNIWGSVDPKSDDYPHQSAFMFCSGNPVVRVDMDGMSDDWVQDSKSLEYKWMDNVTSPSNTPSGYNYVGPNDSDIINHMGLGGKQPTESSNRIGYVAGDVEEGRYAVNHMVNVKAKSDIAITANISYNLNSTDENNKSGRQFKGISISATLINYNSGVDGKISTTAKLNVSYGGKNYISNFTDGNGDMIKQPGSSISNANISIPARALNSSNKMNINITGQWWVRNSSNLNTPVVYHPLTPLPQKFSHGWKF